MRLYLDAPPLELQAAEPADESDHQPRRLLAGLAVPYGVEALVGETLVTFAAGSVTAAERVPLLLGHDPQRPVGVLAEHEETETGLRATFSVDATPEGDVALVQAASGSRAGLSVGVDVVTFEESEDGERITVQAGRLAETSLVSLAAYAGAAVDHVAASQPRAEGADMPDQPTSPAAASDVPEDVPADAPHQPPPMIITARAEPEMRLGEYVQTLVRAERGDRGAAQRIEAALTRGNLAGNPGVVPIAYVSQIVDGLGDERPLFDAVDHAEMPPAGMTIRRPVIATRPDGAFMADDTAAAPTGAVAINNLDETIRQWAWAGSASVALVERSAPSYVEEVFTQAIKSYHRDVEADIAGFFPAAAGGPASLGAAVAAFMAAYRRAPTLLVCGGAAYGKLLDSRGALTFSSGSADASGSATVAGLKTITSPDVATGDAWVTLPELVEVRESAPIRLSVSDVTSLSLEVGVTSFYASVRTLPTSGAVAGAVGIPTFNPVGLEAPAGRSK